MPWARTDWMSERLKLIAAYLGYEASFSDLCHDFGISRKTGYKWVGRYEAEGAAITMRASATDRSPDAMFEQRGPRAPAPLLETPSPHTGCP